MITISLVTYNGVDWLPDCLDSVRNQTMADFELVATDNASTDSSADLLRAAEAADERVTVRVNERNIGFAAAHNQNIDRSRADFVLLLNQDVVLDAGFVAAVLAAFEDRPDVAAVQGRLRRLRASGERTEVLDSTGLVMRRDRRVVARRQGELEAPADLVAGPVWGVDGPAPVYRRAALESIRESRTGGGTEVLDEDFFMYKEDVDLAWRLRRHGWRAWYEPAALAWHARSAGAGPERSWRDIAASQSQIPRWIKQTSWRNHRLMQIKNERPGEYLRDLPWIARREVLSLGFTALVDPRRLAAWGSLARLARPALRKRAPRA